MILQVTQSQLKPVQNLNMEQIYENNCVVMVHNNIYYILVLNEKFEYVSKYVSLSKVNFTPSKIQKLIFTNDSSLQNIYIKKENPRSFITLQQYANWLIQKSEQLKIINITPFSLFEWKELKSNSELVNMGVIELWWQSKYKEIKHLCFDQLKIYNFYNFTLYQLSRNELPVSTRAKKLHFGSRETPQKLTLDLSDHRARTHASNINYYAISTKDDNSKFIKADKDKVLYKVDFQSSYLQLICYILDIDIEGDIYNFLAKQLRLDSNYDRNELKRTVFQILFSNKIREYSHIEFFNKAYLFSCYLVEEYKKQGYVQALISQKKIRLPNNNINRSKLLNMFIMSLETELYIGLLYQMLKFHKDKIKPVIFIYDSIIMQVDINYCLEVIQTIEDVLTMNGVLHLSRYVGKAFNKLDRI